MEIRLRQQLAKESLALARAALRDVAKSVDLDLATQVGRLDGARTSALNTVLTMPEMFTEHGLGQVRRAVEMIEAFSAGLATIDTIATGQLQDARDSLRYLRLRRSATIINAATGTPTPDWAIDAALREVRTALGAKAAKPLVEKSEHVVDAVVGAIDDVSPNVVSAPEPHVGAATPPGAAPTGGLNEPALASAQPTVLLADASAGADHVQVPGRIKRGWKRILHPFGGRAQPAPTPAPAPWPAPTPAPWPAPTPAPSPALWPAPWPAPTPTPTPASLPAPLPPLRPLPPPVAIAAMPTGHSPIPAPVIQPVQLTDNIVLPKPDTRGLDGIVLPKADTRGLDGIVLPKADTRGLDGIVLPSGSKVQHLDNQPMSHYVEADWRTRKWSVGRIEGGLTPELSPTRPVPVKPPRVATGTTARVADVPADWVPSQATLEHLQGSGSEIAHVAPADAVSRITIPASPSGAPVTDFVAEMMAVATTQGDEAVRARVQRIDDRVLLLQMQTEAIMTMSVVGHGLSSPDPATIQPRMTALRHVVDAVTERYLHLSSPAAT